MFIHLQAIDQEKDKWSKDLTNGKCIRQFTVMHKVRLHIFPKSTSKKF